MKPEEAAICTEPVPDRPLSRSDRMLTVHASIPLPGLAHGAMQHSLQTVASGLPEGFQLTRVSELRGETPIMQTNPSQRSSGQLTVVEWITVGSSLTVLVFWLSISFAAGAL